MVEEKRFVFGRLGIVIVKRKNQYVTPEVVYSVSRIFRALPMESFQEFLDRLNKKIIREQGDTNKEQLFRDGIHKFRNIGDIRYILSKKGYSCHSPKNHIYSGFSYGIGNYVYNKENSRYEIMLIEKIECEFHNGGMLTTKHKKFAKPTLNYHQKTYTVSQVDRRKRIALLKQQLEREERLAKRVDYYENKKSRRNKVSSSNISTKKKR